MERPEVLGTLSALLIALVLVAGCVNPFSPALRGTTESLWTDASTVGGLLQNFATAYRLGDSLAYADLLDEQFQFQYYDPQLQRTDGWYRDTDLRATAGMFHSFQNVTLIWGGVSDSTAAISLTGTPVEVRAQYQLALDELSPLIGFASFTLFKPEGGRYRIVLWQDEY